jgi:hypothetical protein
MALAGTLASAVVISDPDFANWLVDYVPTVVFRQVYTDHDPGPFINGDEDHDRQEARAWWHSERLHWHTTRCRKNVFIQLVNEQNSAHDGFFYDELMAQAEREGYKLVIHDDAGGCVGDQDGMRALWFSADGQPQSDFFVQNRGISIRRAARNGHLYGWHSYGNFTDGKYHRSDEESAWPWFSGRGFQFMRLFPASQRPKMLITEFGSGATQLTQAMGFGEMWDNYVKFEQMALRLHPDMMANCLGICQWSTGSAPGFPGQYIDQWLDQIIRVQKG